MNKTKTSRLWSAFVCTGLLFGVVHTVDSTDGAVIQIPVEYAEIVLDALENALAIRAPRPGIDEASCVPRPGVDPSDPLRAPRPGVDPSDPALPVGGCDSAELAIIAACVCAIKNQLISCCSVIDDIDSKIDILITSTTGSCDLTPVITQLDACCSVIDAIDSKVDILLTQTVSCNLTAVTSQLDGCCSIIDDIDSKVDILLTMTFACDLTAVTSQLDQCCSVIEDIDSKVDILLTMTFACDLTVIESQLDSCCSVLEATLGTLGDTGSCFPVITTIADIDNANLDVIQWLKTLMYELRGVC